MAAEDGGVTDGRTNLIPNVVKDGSWHQHAGKHTEPSLFSLIAGLKGLAEVKSKRTHPRHPLRPRRSSVFSEPECNPNILPGSPKPLHSFSLPICHLLVCAELS